MPALEADLTVVMDMKQFFADYHPADETDERFVLMKKKLDFYAGAWELLQERARTYMDMDPDQVTEKGELSKQVSEDYVQRLRALKTEAKTSGAFKTWKKQTPALDMFFAKANERKSKAGRRLTEAEKGSAQQGGLTEEECDELDRLSKQVSNYQSYRIAVDALAGGQPMEDNVRAQREKMVRRYEDGGYGTPLNEQSFQKIQNRIKALMDKDAQSLQFSGSLTKENMDFVLSEIERRSVSLLEFMQSASDEQLIEGYAEKLSDLAALKELTECLYAAEWYRKMYNALTDHESGRELLDDAVKQEYEHYVRPISACRETWQVRGKQIHAGQKAMENRMQEIAKYGCSRGRSWTEQENLLERMTNTRAQVKKFNDQKKDPVTFQKARMLGQQSRVRNGVQEEGIPLGATFAGANVKDSRAALPDALKQLELIKCIRDYKEQHPDAYRLGQSLRDYKNCERLLERLPLLEELVSLTLRINHLDQYGKTIEEKTARSELELRYEQVRQTCYYM